MRVCWKTWVPIGLNGLVNKKKMGPINVFTKEKMRAVAESAKLRFVKGLKKGCEGILGFADALEARLRKV